MNHLTDFVFRIAPPSRVFTAKNAPLIVEHCFADYTAVHLFLPEGCMFADFIIDSQSQRTCGFSFMFEPDCEDALLAMLPQGIQTRSTGAGGALGQGKHTSLLDPADHRINLLWENALEPIIVEAQLDEVQWIVGSMSRDSNLVLIGLSCIKTGGSTARLFVQYK